MRSTGNMLEKVSSGEHLLGYNVLGSYALVRAKKDPSLGVVLPKDYTLVLSRVLFIGKQAKNPNAAKLWTDYVLSAARTEADRRRRSSCSRPQRRRRRIHGRVAQQATGRATSKPIPVSAEIVSYLDPKKRLDFLAEWKADVAAGGK